MENPIFYFLGRFDINHKGLDYLFDSLDLLEKQGVSLKFEIFGTGTAEQIKYVNKRILKYRHLDVQNKGTIYGQKKKEALEKCNILILTSRYEGSPMTVLDGLSYGNPCIVTPGTNVADEVELNNIGWKTELDSSKIAECILKADQEYKATAHKMYERCKKYVEDNYSWDTIAAKSIELYGWILEKK